MREDFSSSSRLRVLSAIVAGIAAVLAYAFSPIVDELVRRMRMPRRAAAVPIRPAVSPAPTARPLEGVKVLDLMWVMAGPAGSRVLADYGARCIRVESVNKLDAARNLQPFRDDVGNPDNSGLWNNMNAGKWDLSLDMSKAAALDVIWDLIEWADVVVESFSPRAMKARYTFSRRSRRMPVARRPYFAFGPVIGARPARGRRRA